MNKVLIISYYFPPAGGSAVQRILKFVKYLPEFGWHPVVLTARGKDYLLRDDSLMDEIDPSIPVYRVPAIDLYDLYLRCTQKGEKGAPDLSAIAAGEKQIEGALHRLALLVRACLFIPDARIGWLPHAVIRARSIIKKEKIKIIFASSPPFTTALIGALVSSLMKLPWVSDYRDPWTQAYFYFPRPKISRIFEEFLEKLSLRSASFVISINNRILDGLHLKYGLPVKEREAVIPNGYDPEDFKNIDPVKDKHFTITYTGTLNSRMHPASFLEAVARLCESEPDFKRKVRINFIGRIGEDILPQFDDHRLRGNVRLIDHLSHRQCLRYTLGADLLLLLIPEYEGNELIVTGKLFEYLRSGNPIICMSTSGDAADIIKKTGAGFTVDGKDISQIKRVIYDCFQRWREGRNVCARNVKWNVISQYDRVNITQQLANLFTKIAEKTGSG